MNCKTCGRLLSQPDDPLSIDCGGDCWGCIGELEAELGNPDSIARVKDEAAKGLRPNCVDPSADAA